MWAVSDIVPFNLSRGLLVKAGYKIAENMSSLTPEDAVTVLLVYSFFGVKNPE